MKSLKERRSVLNARLEYLDAKLHEIDDELDSHSSPDWEEMAVDRETDEVLEGMGLSGLDEMRAITAALERMDEGEYGSCVTCGDRISEDRLDSVPFTPFCRSCAAAKAKAR